MIKARKASEHRAAKTENKERIEQPKWASVKLRHRTSSSGSASHTSDDNHSLPNVPKSPALPSPGLPPRPGSAARARTISAGSVASVGSSVSRRSIGYCFVFILPNYIKHTICNTQINK